MNTRRKVKNRIGKRGDGPAGMAVERPLRARREQIFTTLLTRDVGRIDISGPPILSAYNFTVGQFSASSTLLAVFDQYRIRKVTVTLYPQVVNNFIAASVPATLVPTIIYNLNTVVTAVDNDDSATPGSEAVVLAHETAISHGPFNKPITRTFVPMVAASVYQTGGFGGYSAEISPWLDSVSTAVEHYGLKLAIANGTTMAAGLVGMTVFVSAEVDFRKVF